MQVAGASLGSPVRCRVLGAKRVIVHAPKAPHRPRKAATHVVLQETAVSTAPDQADTSDFLKMVNLEVKSDRQEAVLLQGKQCVRLMACFLWLLVPLAEHAT